MFCIPLSIFSPQESEIRVILHRESDQRHSPVYRLSTLQGFHYHSNWDGGTVRQTNSSYRTASCGFSMTPMEHAEVFFIKYLRYLFDLFVQFVDREVTCSEGRMLLYHCHHLLAADWLHKYLLLIVRNISVTNTPGEISLYLMSSSVPLYINTRIGNNNYCLLRGTDLILMMLNIIIINNHHLISVNKIHKIHYCNIINNRLATLMYIS